MDIVVKLKWNISHICAHLNLDYNACELYLDKKCIQPPRNLRNVIRAFVRSFDEKNPPILPIIANWYGYARETLKNILETRYPFLFLQSIGINKIIIEPHHEPATFIIIFEKRLDRSEIEYYEDREKCKTHILYLLKKETNDKLQFSIEERIIELY